jgi:branched-chain amino acid aminotransferase
MAGTQDFQEDPRNARVLVNLNGDLVPRDEAKVSIFDAGFVVGDGVWEGIRLHKGALLFLDEHLDRLYAGARQIALDRLPDRRTLQDELWRTLDANGFTHGAHLRVMATRGVKSGANQDPRNALGPPTLVILAEIKEPALALWGAGIALATASIRCTPAEMFDMRLNSHSRLNLITALLEAIKAGADEALMLDPHGFVSSCNATNFFFVREGQVMTSTGRYCFNGVTRAKIMELCRANGLALVLGDHALEAAAEADEAFVTGTFGGVTPVRSLDGRPLRFAVPGPVTTRLRQAYDGLKDEEARRHVR